MPRFSDRWYARRPYLGLGQSLVDFFNSPVRFLKESNTIESQFEKPYAGPDYRALQFKLPVPDWPTWKFGQPARPKAPRPPFPYDRNQDEIERVIRECPCCFFVWWGTCDDDDAKGGQFFPIFSDVQPIVRKDLTVFDPVAHGRWSISGNYKAFREYPPAANANSTAAFAHAAYFDFDENALTGDGFAFVTLCYELPGVCKHCVDYWAPCAPVDCPPATPFTFDDPSTPDTIVKSTTVTAYVLGGTGPFTWTFTGDSTGYTFPLGATSVVRNNNIRCGGGTCGVHYAVTINVTVTDACGGTVSFELRNTDGHWGAQFVNIARCTSGGSDCQSCFVFGCVPTTQTNCQATGPVVDLVGGARWITDWKCMCDTVDQNGNWCVGGVDRDGDAAYVPPSFPTLASSITSPHECDDGGYNGVCIGDTSSHWHWIC